MFSSLLNNKIDIIRKYYEGNREFFDISFVFFILLIIFFAPTIFLGLYPSGADVLTLWPVFSQNDAHIQNGIFSDVVTQFEPWLIFEGQNIRDFSIPLWNSYSGTGVPLIANMQSALFYPFNWPALVFGLTPLTLLFLYFCKIYFTGIFTYYYLREIKLQPISSMVGAIAFMFGGYIMIWLYWPSSSSIFVLPALLFLIEKIISKPDIKYLIGISIITAMGAFSGHPETFFHIGIITIIYFVFRIITTGKTIKSKFNILFKYVSFSIAGLMLSAVQLIPFIEYMFNSYVLTSRENVKLSLPWESSILNFMPEFYGSHSIKLFSPYYHTLLNNNETLGGYVGISMLCLALYAVFRAYKIDMVKFYSVMCLWALCVVYKIYPIFEITTSIPPFSIIANHRLLFFIGFCFIVLGAIGLNKLLTGYNKDMRKNELKWFIISITFISVIMLFLSYFNRIDTTFYNNLTTALFQQNIEIIITLIFIILTLVLILLILYFYDKKRIFKLLIIIFLILIFIETGIHGMLYEPTIQGKYFYPDNTAFDNITANGQLYRTTSIDNDLNKLGIYPVNTQMIYGIYDIRNYDAIENKYYWTLFNNLTKGNLYGWVTISDIDSRFLNFMGVKWIFSGTDLRKVIDTSITHNTNPVGEMVNGYTVDQEFFVQKPNLSRIELLYATYGRKDIHSNITISLIDKKSKDIVTTTTINSDNLSDNQWYALEFEPIKESANNTYILHITANGTPENSITLWMDSVDPSIVNGKLLLNGIPVNGSICIKTFCENNNGYILTKSYSEYYLFENPDVMPRAFIMHNSTYISDNTEILGLLTNSTFDWRSDLILSGNDSQVTYPDGNSSVNIVEYDPTYAKINVNSSEPGFLVLSDAYYPGWNAYINNKPVEILRADYAFRAVKIDGGNSTVEFKYQPMSFYIGTTITFITALILSLLLLLPKIYKMK